MFVASHTIHTHLFCRAINGAGCQMVTPSAEDENLCDFLWLMDCDYKVCHKCCMFCDHKVRLLLYDYVCYYNLHPVLHVVNIYMLYILCLVLYECDYKLCLPLYVCKYKMHVCL